MTHGILPRKGLPAALAILVALAAGCNTSLQKESYPPGLKYPARSDVIVVKKSSAEPKALLTGPGLLDEGIAQALEADKEAKGVKPAEVSKEQATELAAALEELFGTPASPRVLVADAEDGLAAYWRADQSAFIGVSSSLFADMEITPAHLARGSKLYRRHCLHCHGVAGDGRGPTGPWVHPHPRDYRSGLFKFISTNDELKVRKPKKDDLIRVLRQGIDGTSMPAFGLLPDHELEYLAAYVIHLSVRGETELQTLKDLAAKTTFEGNKSQKAKPDASVGEVTHRAYANAAQIALRWAECNANEPIAAPPVRDLSEAGMQKSIERGHELFIGKGICITCHFDYGRQPNYRYDEWGTLVRPANLTVGTYRGGRRPLDVLYRVKGGIQGSGMSAMPKMTKEDPNDKKNLLDDPEATERAYWDLVHFVRALPYPSMLPEDVRRKVYGASELKSKK